MTTALPSSDLPSPARERFQPLRSGLVNLFRYDDQEFWFEDGHLLLRGNNGTGKSRVLALQLPFLFDGEVAPHRMEPDGDPAKRAEWNLLMGGRHADRLGYTWIELGRRAPELAGGEEFVTLGCGLSAATGRGLVGRWFFVTNRRIGRDLFLVAPTGQALSRERLVEALGDEGTVYATAAKYREAVDAALFGLGAYRYEALMNLLVQLRQPQLSRQLDEERLSRALSEALPPPAPQLVADVAEAFRSLETDEEALAGFRAAQGAVEQFLAEYRRYVQMAARRRAAALRLRQSGYESALRRLREAERELGEAVEGERALAAEIAEARLDEETAIATADALAASPAMQDAEALRRARDAAERAAVEVARGEDERTRRAEQAAHRQRERLDADAAVEVARAELETRDERLRRAAGDAGIAARHAVLTSDRLVTEEVVDLTGLLRALDLLLDERRRALRHLRALGEAWRQAEAALARADAGLVALTHDVDGATEAERAAAAARDGATGALLAAYRQWVAACGVLSPAPAEAIVDALLAWADGSMGAGPIAAAVSQSLASALEELASTRAAADARLGDLQARLVDLRQEQARLGSGAHRPPAAPPTRDAEARLTRPGAPLWCLVDFAPELPATERAGLEAALEAAGILDAWVTPDGRLLAPGENDVVLVAAGGAVPATSHLGQALVPAVDPRDPRVVGLGAQTIATLLGHIGLGAGSGAAAWVDVDGRFRLGPLDGRFGKPSAEHIGEGARAAARRRRLEQLAEEIAGLEADERRAVAELAHLDARRSAAQAEAQAAPDDHGVRAAAAELEARGRALLVLRGRMAEAQARVLEARAARDARRAAREVAALDLGLGDLGDDLAGLEDALARYGAEIAALGPALAHARSTRTRAREAAARLEEAQVEAVLAEERLAELRAHFAARTAERVVLEDAVGVAVEEILLRHAEARRRVRALRLAREARAARERQTLERRVHAEDERARTEGAVRAEERARDEAASSLARLGRMRLLGVAVPALAIASTENAESWSVTRTVEVARTIEAALERVDAADAAWERSQKGLFGHVQTLEQSVLIYGHQATTTLEDDVLLVEMPFQGRPHTMAEFGEILAAEVVNRQTLLSAREREVLENHLVGEVSMHLHDRLHAAERLVREMNDELSARPMSTGMTLRFSWKPLDDGPPGLPEARRRLMRAGGTWSAAEREALGTFLSKRIEEVRAAEIGGTWQDHLAEALDYRRWHSFGVERLQDGMWKPLTRRTHGTGSGGEKAVALTLPQFAAAAAHYRSADRKAPRLILLDEVFVGVDSDMRAKCMGLLSTFDLDFVMTSEREWGCYTTLPAVAIYQLATRPDIDAVGVTRFVWNGRERLRADPEPPGARAAVVGGSAGAEGTELALSFGAAPAVTGEAAGAGPSPPDGESPP